MHGRPAALVHGARRWSSPSWRRRPPPPLRPPPPPPTSRPRTAATTPTPRWSPTSRRPRRPTRTSSTCSRSARATRAARSGPPRSPTTSRRDEPEPEVLFDSLHHAREHLSLEQNLALLRWLTDGLRHGHADHRHREHARDLDRVRGQPRRRRVRPRPATRTARGARTASRTPGSTTSARTSTATTATSWGCCGGSSGRKASATYRGKAPFSAPETQAMRDFMAQPPGRRPPADQDRDHVPHRGRADPVAVRLHEDRRPGRHDRRRPRRARRDGQEDGRDERLHADAVERAVHHRRRRDRLGVRHAAHLDVHVRALPEPRQGQPSTPASTRPTSSSSARPSATSEAILYLIERAGCRYSVIGKSKANCGPLFDDFETPRRLGRRPARHRHRHARRVGARQPVARPPGRRARVPSGSRALVTGRAGRLDARRPTTSTAAITTVRSRADRACPATTGRLSFRYYLAHSSNASSGDYFRAYVEAEDGDADAREAGERPPPTSTSRRWTTVSDLDGAVGRRRRSGSSSRPPTRAARARSRRPSTTSGSAARSVGAAATPERGPATGRRRRPRSSPPWASTSPRAIASPSPEPRDAVALHEPVEDVGQQRRVDARARCRATVEHDRPRPRPAPRTRHGPPAGVWRSAFATRFERTSRIRTGSMSRIGRSSATSAASSTPARGRRGPERAHDLADEHVGIGRLGVEGERAGLGQRERPQVVDQPLQDARLVEDRRRGAPRRPDRRRR